jgi:hypothetical protein
MAKDQTAFSLVDQYFTLSMYLDNIPAGLVSIIIRLSSTAGGATNFKQYTIPAADLVAGAGTFNHFSIDVNNDTPTATSGTYNPASTIATQVQFIFNASSTMVAALDFIVHQPNWILPLPYKTRIFDATNVEWFYVTSVAGTGYHQRRTYTVAALTNSYAVSTTYAKQRNVTISGNQGIFPSGLAGAVAKVVHDIKTYWLPKSVVADVPVSWRFWDEEFKVSTLSSSTATKIASATDKKAYFKAGDEVILYQKQTNGIMFGSKYNSTITKNFKILTLSIDSTFGSSEIELTHTGYTNSGADTSYWYIVRYSVKRMAILEAMAANGALAYVIPLTLITSGDMFIFSDNFNRTNGVVGNNWTVVNDFLTGAASPFSIVSNKLQSSNPGDFTAVISKCYRNLENYTNKKYYKVTGTYTRTLGAGNANWDGGKVEMFANPSYSHGGGAVDLRSYGTGLGLSFNHTVPSGTAVNTITLMKDTTTLATVAFTCVSGTTYNFEVFFGGSGIKAKIWDTTYPTSWTIESSTTAPAQYPYFMLVAYMGDQVHTIAFDDIKIIDMELSGYSLSGTVSGTGDKFVDALEYSKQDTTNQNPVGYQFDAYVPGLTE